jgi:uncharacterized membrane protein YoaK (UPF0700 family)
MTEQSEDWVHWQEAWRTTPPKGAEEQRRAHRRYRGAEVAQVVVVLAAIALLAVALRYAASPFELAFGVSVVAAIFGVWIAHRMTRTSEASALTRDSIGHLAALHALRDRELRIVRFVWLVLSLEGAYLTTWWIGGSAFHDKELDAPIAILVLGTPIVAMIALVAWAALVRRRAKAELRRIAKMEQDFSA